MIKSLQCILLISSVLSTALFRGENIGLTKEIDNMRETVVCAVERETEESAEQEDAVTVGYTEGFWVEEDETVYLLETYGNRVLEVKRKEVREIPLSATVLPTDIVCVGENMYVFDEILSELQIYTRQGELVQRSKVVLQNDYVKQLVKTETGVSLLTYGGQLLFIDAETGVQTVTEALLPEISAKGYSFAEYIAMDEEGAVYSVHTRLVTDCSVISGELTLWAENADGTERGSYILPTNEYIYLPGTYVQVLENGNIYILVPMEQKTEVRKIALKESMESAYLDISEEASEVEKEYAADSRYRKRIGTACTRKIALTREEVYKRAVAMAEYEWTLKKTHTLTSKSEKGVVLPREIAAIKEDNADKSSWSVQVTGIPYCWGGFYALDVGFGGKTFPSVIDKKYVAGNVNPEGYHKYMTAGLDCSGYVSAAFGFASKESTGSLSDLGSKVSDVNKLESMDILVHPGEHVIFYLERLDEATLLVSESNVRNGKVVIHPKSLNELAVSGMYQMRSPW